jgi:trehalose-6-phosphatase
MQNMSLSPDAVLDQITRSQKSWLILDYEGTLTERRSDSDTRVPDAALENMMVDLVRRPAISIAILSRWRLEELRSLLPVPGLWLAGSFGAEWSIPDEEGVLRPESGSDSASGAEPASQAQAISFLLEKEPADDSLLVFVGNGDGDGGAAKIVHEHGGIAMQVNASPKPAAADCRFDSPRALRGWLKQIILKIPPVRL